jgi:hypothetical protein
MFKKDDYAVTTSSGVLWIGSGLRSLGASLSTSRLPHNSLDLLRLLSNESSCANSAQAIHHTGVKPWPTQKPPRSTKLPSPRNALQREPRTANQKKGRDENRLTSRREAEPCRPRARHATSRRRPRRIGLTPARRPPCPPGGAGTPRSGGKQGSQASFETDWEAKRVPP